jgi:hypothetical protein
MSALGRRLSRIEDRRSKDAAPAIIFVTYQEADGEEGQEAARTEAAAKWEAENGPLANRGTVIFCVRRPTEWRT